MHKYKFRTDDFNLKAMIESGLVVEMVTDGEFTIITTSECCDDWFL